MIKYLKFVLFLATIILIISSCKNSNDQTAMTTTKFDRILQENKIRCSYLLYPPYFMKDPNSGKMSGIFYDIMEKIGKNSGLDIEWADNPIGYDNIFTDLNSNKSDVFAGGLWPNSTRAKAGFFSIPVFYSIITAWGRSNETRFLGTLDSINSKNVRIATIYGAMEDIIAKNDFPKANRDSLPPSSPFIQSLLNITSGKSDVTFAEPSIISEFTLKNPGTLKELGNGKPLRIFGNCLVINKNEYDLQEFLNISLLELLYSGEVDNILKRYETNSQSFKRISLPYQEN